MYILQTYRGGKFYLKYQSFDRYRTTHGLTGQPTFIYSNALTRNLDSAKEFYSYSEAKIAQFRAEERGLKYKIILKSRNHPFRLLNSLRLYLFEIWYYFFNAIG